VYSGVMDCVAYTVIKRKVNLTNREDYYYYYYYYYYYSAMNACEEVEKSSYTNSTLNE